MTLTDYLFGRRLATFEEGEQRVGVLSGIPMLGLDALGSAAYGPEAALTLLSGIDEYGFHLTQGTFEGDAVGFDVSGSSAKAFKVEDEDDGDEDGFVTYALAWTVEE